MAGLLLSKTIGGAEADDELIGGDTGLDLGVCEPGSYTPVVDQESNTGAYNAYVSHDYADPITDVKHYIRPFNQTYGGASSSAADHSIMATLGAASDDDPTNAGKAGAGLRVEQDAFLADGATTLFLASREEVKVYGRAGLGLSYETAFDLSAEAMGRNNAGTLVTVSAPVDGQIGTTGSTTLGDTAFLRLRQYLQGQPPGNINGVRQMAFVIAYDFEG